MNSLIFEIMEKKYTPKPIDLQNIQLPGSLNELAESIAKNVHEVWAQGRIEQGWSYGPVRNEELKQTPCLVPYEELSEEEKDYDRRTALNTIKLIIKMGYTITSPK